MTLPRGSKRAWISLLIVLIAPFTIASCTQADKDLLFGKQDPRPEWERCLTKVAGDKLDDFEAYSSRECGHNNRRGLVGDDTFAQLVKDKNGNGFFIQIVSLIYGIDVEFDSVRFLSHDKVVEEKTTPYYKTTDCSRIQCVAEQMYVIPVPWTVFEGLSGDVTLRFSGKFRYDSKIMEKRISTISRFVKTNSLDESEKFKNVAPMKLN
jgi:hypothetical protein